MLKSNYGNMVNNLSGLRCISYKLKSGETLTDIARKYESTCNLNNTIKMIKLINKIEDENNINSQTVVNIPER
ncbi:LysM peptidoglycan-binding domain-containing protein [Clostridium chromiireducens]|uniref:LysM peptidoglycan-binding domain-containing protein n=1 Tax=Clostridium chromiireducens TaxID=225345 RepID=UPI003AF50A78